MVHVGIHTLNNNVDITMAISQQLNKVTMQLNLA
jgi:hypothetical protein